MNSFKGGNVNDDDDADREICAKLNDDPWVIALVPIGGSGVWAPGMCPLWIHFFCHFHVVFGEKLATIIGWSPHLSGLCPFLWEILDPPLVAL